MTDQHRATPEQWKDVERQSVFGSAHSCLLELRARVEALETAQQQPRPPHQDKLDRLIALDRDDPANAGSLVERVAGAMGCNHPSEWGTEARAAIREVAAWLRTFPEMRTTPQGVATSLEYEAAQ